MSFGVRAWWVALSIVVSLNMLVWCWAAGAVRSERPRLTPAALSQRRRHLALSGVYVLVCAFRAYLPRADVQRICLVDSVFSSVLVGRSLATVAELCFAAQWALFVGQLAAATGRAGVRLISRLLLPLIGFAELASWYAVVKTNFLGNVIEQSTWTLCGGLIALSYLQTYARVSDAARRYMRWTFGVIVVFIAFMVTVDIRHYLALWAADERAGKLYLDWRAGLRDAAQRWRVVYDWEPWRPEIAWMSLYFSVGVWVSISFTRAPCLGRSAAQLSKQAGPGAFGAQPGHAPPRS